MKPGVASAAVAIPYFEGQNELVRISQQCLSGGLYWTQVPMVTFSLKERTHNVLYMIRSVPQSWHIANGIFSTEKIGHLDLIFPEYSHSKRMHITPHIVDPWLTLVGVDCGLGSHLARLHFQYTLA